MATDAELPPILVDRSTMQVIDGAHRVRAAELRGEDCILARYLDDSCDDVFAVSVWANVTHGLPLSRAERTDAATRLLGAHPDWSDRRLAATTGLSATTVGAIRGRSTVHGGQSADRVGRDGRSRPASGVAGRLRARDLIEASPRSSTRAIAREAGVSPSTVQDVRKRLDAGLEPVPDRFRTAAKAGRAQGLGLPEEPEELLQRLKLDPSLRFTDDGKRLLRLLDCWVGGLRCSREVIDRIPIHCLPLLSTLVEHYAAELTGLAAKLATDLEAGGERPSPRGAPEDLERSSPDESIHSPL